MKNKKTSLYITSLVLLGVVALPLQTHALALGSTIGSAAQIGSGQSTSSTQSSNAARTTAQSGQHATSATSNLGITIGTGNGTTATVSGNAGVGTTTASSTSGGTTENNTTPTDSSSNTTADSDTILSSPIVVTHDSIKNDMSGTMSETSAAVHDNATLTSYAHSLVAQDDNINKVSIDNTEIALWYKQPAKFLGFIPMSVNTKASVQADGTVAIHYPWYTFLTKVQDSHAQTDLQARVQMMLGHETASSTTGATTETRFDAQTRARMLEEMRAVLENSTTSTANASAQTSADANATSSATNQ